MTLTENWVEVTPSQFTHEAEGLRLVRELLPDEPPFRAWSNFEFRDEQGKWHEIDLVVLGRRRMHLIELKYYSGTLRGDDHVWRRDGHPAEDSPLKLARRKAQRLAGRLTDELRDWARQTGAQIPEVKTVVPFVQEAVLLHHPKLTCLLSDTSRRDLFGLGDEQSNLPGIGQRLLEAAEANPRWSIGTNRSAIIAKLMKRIGAVQRRQREAGSWIIDEEPLDEGDGWQEWPAFHRVTQERKARIRFFIDSPGESQSECKLRKFAAEHEFRTISGLRHDGIIEPIDLVDTELGTGLVYERADGYQRLDLWMADHPDGITLLDQLSVIRQVGEALAYAHRHRVAHRGLNPSAVFIRRRHDGTLRTKVGNWQAAGLTSAGTATGTGTGPARSPATLLGDSSATALRDRAAGIAGDTGVSPGAFRAPEGVWARNADRIRLDVFGLGALAYYLIAGRPPASDTTALRERLTREHGLDLAADLPQVPSRLRQLVLDATMSEVPKRTADLPTFLENLAEAERIITEPDRDDHADPLEARPGDLIAGRFRLEQHLGSGSTAVALLVTDLAQGPDKADTRPVVLKVAVDDKAAQRLADEADALRKVRSPRIIRLLEGPLRVGVRTALLVQFAGAQTLADELTRRTRLSLDLLERYGNDLLAALTTLDGAGIDHRDIKPANLGIAESRKDKSKHLMLFDFSLSHAPAAAIDAGTRGYLDPFLGAAGRDRYDSAAERYAAAVVLFEMATGTLPVYGDGSSDPVAARGMLRLDDALFDPAIAGQLHAFFDTALAPGAAKRHHTAQDMAAAWAAVFATVSRTQPEGADRLANDAKPGTPLTGAGLSARALSAIEPLGVSTVGDLVALDAVRLNRLPGVADTTRREVKSRARQWRDRLGAQVLGRPARPAAGGGVLPDPASAAELLAAPFTRPSLRRQAVRAILGLDPGLDAFVPQGGLGVELGASKPRGSQLIDEMQRSWGEHQPCRELLEALRSTVFTALDQLGGVATVTELAEAIRAVLPGPVAATAETARLADGLLRVTLDRAAALARAGALDAQVQRRRDRTGRLTLLATRPDLLTGAEAAGRRADALVDAASAAAEPLIAPGRAAVQLGDAFAAEIDPDAGDDALPDGPRLVRLAAALSRHAAVTGDGSLYHRDLPLADAVRIAISALAPGQRITAGELRDRVRARFPAAPALPDRSHGLDDLVARAGLPLVYDDEARAYRSREYRRPTTGLATRVTVSGVPPLLGGGGRGQVAIRLADSMRTRSFLALGVSADYLARATGLLGERCGARPVDVTGVLIEAMRAEAAARNVRWDVVTAADAAEPGSQDAAGLAALVALAIPAVHRAIQQAADEEAGPVLITEAAPLARYRHLAGLARWTDLAAPRPAAIWLLVPQLHGSTAGLIDGQPLPLAAPGQFLQLDDEWLAPADPTGTHDTEASRESSTA